MSAEAQEEAATALRMYRLLPRRAWRQVGATLPWAAVEGAAAAEVATPGAASSTAGASGTPKAAAKKGRNALPREVQLSKALSQVCRHKATSMSLSIRPDGYLVLREVLRCKMLEKFKATAEEIDKIVQESDKQRFTLAEIAGERHIRANQGHSMKEVQDELLLEKLRLEDSNLPAQVVHGTYTRHWSSILEKGLLAGGKQGQKFRNHVHFATGLPKDGGVISGMRESCDLAVYLNLDGALRADLPLYRSSNEVLLSPGFDGVVPVELFSRAVRLKDGVQIWPPATASPEA